MEESECCNKNCVELNWFSHDCSSTRSRAYREGGFSFSRYKIGSRIEITLKF